MTPFRRVGPLVLSVSLFLASCEDGGTPRSASCCMEGAACDMVVGAYPPRRVTSAPLVLNGFASSRRAIRALYLAGLKVEGAFNFRTWSVTLDERTLNALPRAASSAMKTGEVVVELPIRLDDDLGHPCIISSNRARFVLDLKDQVDAGPGESPQDAGPVGATGDAAAGLDASGEGD